jgi:molybdate transport system permease protein
MTRQATSVLASGTQAPSAGVRWVGHRARGPGVPAALLVPALVGLAFLVLPMAGLLVKIPWDHLVAAVRGAAIGQALRLSLISASLATGISLVLGVPLAWLLARTSFVGQRLVRALVTIPLVLPPVVGGLALLLVLGRNGLLGRYLFSVLGVSLPFTTAGVVVAEAFVAMPFLVISVEGALRSADRRYEEAAATLGASRWMVFWRVTLPLIGPGMVAGAVLCWARALGEFGATITFAGSFPGQTETMPLAVYLQLAQSDVDSAVLLSLVLLIVSLLVLASLRDRWISPTS